MTLNGGGTVTLSNTMANRIYSTTGIQRLTNSDNTIAGAGQIGDHSMALTNNGTIVANLNSSNRLTIDPSPSSGVINNGTLRATNGGFLRLQNGSFTNSSGTVNAQNSSEVELTGATVIGGALTTAGTGVVRNIGTATLNNLTNSGAFAANNNTNTNLVGTINNAGNIALNSAGNNTNLIIQGDVTLGGGGTVTLTNTTANRIYGATNTDRLTNNNTISGAGSIGVNFMSLTNNGTILANSSQPLILDPGPSGFINASVLRADGGPLQLTNGSFANIGGVTINARNGSQAQLNVATVMGGTLSTTGGATAGLIRNIGTATLQNLTNSGAFAADNNTNDESDWHHHQYRQRRASIRRAICTDLIIQGNVTLNGGGTVTLTNTTANRIYGAS